jgi:hypothetical protein
MISGLIWNWLRFNRIFLRGTMWSFIQLKAIQSAAQVNLKNPFGETKQ